MTSTTSSSSSFPSESISPGPFFTKFTDLPPELRFQIWRSALPIPGVNFFNVHCIPNDHPGVNRSTSPPWLYLDLRRLSITDDDATVAEYDPSAWQARQVLRQVCHEARDVCTLPPAESAIIILTRPRRGLFVTAGDLQTRRSTPSTRSSPRLNPEPLEHRRVQVRVDDVLCLSVENCSFNLPFEEMPLAYRDGDNLPEEEVSASADLDELGWTYDPQLTPLLPAAIPQSRLCMNMARGGRIALHYAGMVLLDMLSVCQSSCSGDRLDKLPLIMLDAYKQELGGRRVAELTPQDEIFWDRFGDRYLMLPWESSDLPADYRLTKVWPEISDIRERYLRSALLRSPKRPMTNTAA